MRTPSFIVAIAAVMIVADMACSKDKAVPPPASFNVIHAMATGNPIVPKLGSDTSGRYFSQMVQVYYGSSQLYSPVAESAPFVVVPITDTAFKIFNGNIKLESGAIYSFFLSGDTAHADTMLVRDYIPYYSDSSAGVRFVNLSIGGKAVTINLVSDPSHTEFSPLGYRAITNFKKYDATAGTGGSYQFEIRDQASGTVLTTYIWTFAVRKNNTIIIAGSPDPTSPTPLNVFAVNNY